MRPGVKVLIVEDDDGIRTALGMALEDEGFEVEEAGSGEEGLLSFGGAPADLVIVDVMLPGINGFAVCAAIRRISAVPILFLTARTDTEDVVAGLEAGADDYVVKPFVIKELAARMRALLRRAAPAKVGDVDHVLSFGEVRVWPERGDVERGGTPVHLTRTEFRLLCELAEDAGRVLSREVLLQRVWGYDWFGDGRLVDVHIRRLRSKVEQSPGDPRHIVTVRGLGYKLVP